MGVSSTFLLENNFYYLTSDAILEARKKSEKYKFLLYFLGNK